MLEPISLQAAGAAWRVKPGYERFVQDVLGPAARAPEALPGAERIKHNRVRTVARLQGPEGPLFCKRFRVVRPMAGWLHLLKASPALREWRVLRHLTRRGVRCPEPVVLGEERRCLLVGSVLATREEAGSEQANRCIERLRAAGATDELRELVGGLARAVHAVVRAGVDHPDLHVGNFLVARDGGLVALDMHSARIVGRSLGAWWTRRRLAKLVHSLGVGMVVPPSTALAEVRWFAATYAALEPSLGSERALAAALIEGARRVEAVRLASRARRCLVDSTQFAVEGDAARRVYRARSVAPEVVDQACAAPAARVVRLGGGRVGRVEQLAPDATALGRSLERRRFGSARHAAAVWRAARSCQVRGVPTARALAFVRRGLLGEGGGTLVLEPLAAPDVERLAAETHETRERRRLAWATGCLVGRLHGSGLEHRALHARFLTAACGEDGWVVGLTGLEFVAARRPSPERAAAALARLARGLDGVTPREQRTFLAGYCRSGGERVFSAGVRPARAALGAELAAAAGGAS